MQNKIIIIDDDTDFVEATKILLEASGYDVIYAFSGQDGFQKIKQESPDLILLDLMMTYKTEGSDTAKVVTQDAASRDIPILMITGARKEMDFPFELKPGSDSLPVKAIVEKPIKPEVLLSMIDKYISRSGGKHRMMIEQISKFVDQWKDKKGNLIMILHEIQNHYGYVPRGISFELSRMLDVPLSRIYEVITFYNFFKLDPPGKHLVSICMGTACYLKGAPAVLNSFKNILNVEEGQTTKDGLFHLQVVRCLGCCGLAPVVMVDDKVYGKVKESDVMEIVSEYVKKDANKAKEQS